MQYMGYLPTPDTSVNDVKFLKVEEESYDPKTGKFESSPYLYLLRSLTFVNIYLGKRQGSRCRKQPHIPNPKRYQTWNICPKNRITRSSCEYRSHEDNSSWRTRILPPLFQY